MWNDDEVIFLHVVNERPRIPDSTASALLISSVTVVLSMNNFSKSLPLIRIEKPLRFCPSDNQMTTLQRFIYEVLPVRHA